ncbi:MAG: citramalate synthase, partial [Deltaproteobacteria bacterium]
QKRDQGYQFDAAEGSLDLLIKKFKGQFKEPFSLHSLRVINEKNKDGGYISQATIKISAEGEEEITAAEGNGPVNAIDNALRKALSKFYPRIKEMGLIDFKVRVLEGSAGTAAKVRVLIESRDGRDIWNTVGVSENIIDASWQALVDSIYFKLCKDQAEETRFN